ncbi:MAG: ABC transporter permease [Pyrinomonadaceae bacterium]|nr:ABC transporter permease [Pyrinomonadaceae bacterium]
MRTVLQDLRYGMRTLWKNPGFTLVAVLALALGIGANTTIFSAINSLLLHPFSFRDADRIMAIWESNPQAGFKRGSVAPANFLDIRSQNTVFESVAAFTGRSFNLTEGDKPERIEGAGVSPQFFSVLGVEAAAGRTFLAEEEQAGRDAVVVISDSLWQRRFGRDQGIVGRVVPINNRSFTIVGVMPADFDFPRGGVEMWSPFVFDNDDMTDRASHYLRMLARLKPQVTMEQAQSEVGGLMRRLAGQYPETNAGRGVLIETLREANTGGPRPFLLIALGAVGFVLLIACANVANLLLLRAAARQKEMAIRAALGASRWQLMRQLLTESVLLALLGGSLGLLLSVWAVDSIRAGMPPNFARLISGWKNMGIDWNVFGFTLLVSLATGIIFGTIPALLASKTNLNEALKEGGRSSTEGRGPNRTRSMLVIMEVALSLVLLAGAGLMVRSFLRMMDTNPGFDANSVVTMEIALPNAKYTEEQQRETFFKRLLQRVETLPGVSAAGAVSQIPLGFDDSDTYFSVEGRPKPEPGKRPFADFRVISADYFGAMRIPLRKGRTFTERDTPDAPPVVIISSAMARGVFPDAEPLGKRLYVGDGERAREIVGVVGDIRHEPFSDELNRQTDPTLYVPHAQVPRGSMVIVIRSAASDPAQLTAAVQNEVRQVDKDQPVYNIRTMPQIVAESMSPQRVTAFLFGGFALIALVLASIGIYAVVSYSVAQRTHEIGIRMALGAEPRDIFRLVVGGGMKLILIGITLGMIAAFAVTRLMASILYGVSATDFITFASIALLLAAVALLACYIPARRATKVDPGVALRYE